MAPAALPAIARAQVSPYPFAMIFAPAASSIHDTDLLAGNTLVVGPGQYSFDNFVKVGAPFTVVVAIVSVLFVPLFLPFH